MRSEGSGSAETTRRLVLLVFRLTLLFQRLPRFLGIRFLRRLVSHDGNPSRVLLVEQRNDDGRLGPATPQPPTSDGTDVLSLFALAAGTYVELDSLALFQCLVAGALNRREVHEDIVTLFA